MAGGLQVGLKINPVGGRDGRRETKTNQKYVGVLALLDFEIIMLDLTRWFVSWRCALRYPLSRVRVLLGGRRVTGCRSAVQVLHFYPVSCCVSPASFGLVSQVALRTATPGMVFPRFVPSLPFMSSGGGRFLRVVAGVGPAVARAAGPRWWWSAVGPGSSGVEDSATCWWVGESSVASGWGEGGIGTSRV